MAFQEISGIAITVWSEQNDFAAIGFIVDQIDALITEWYPGEYESRNSPFFSVYSSLVSKREKTLTFFI